MMEIENFRADPIDDSRTFGLDLDPNDPAAPAKRDKLDSPAMLNLHSKLISGWHYERRRQGPNRFQMAIDQDFYDSIQLTDDDLQTLINRGQDPLVYNLVKRSADWITGTERRTRIDFKVLGRTRDDVKDARLKTDSLKYLGDVNNTHFWRSEAFKECIVAGMGWLEDGVRADADEEPLYSAHESWRFMLHDSHASRLDMRDARYLYRDKWVDVDLGEAMFPDRAHVVRQAAIGALQADDLVMDEYYLGNRVSGEDYLAGKQGHYSNSSLAGYVDNTRERARLIEAWYRKPVRDKVLRGAPELTGAIYDQNNDDHKYALLSGECSLVDRLTMGMHYALMTESRLLATGRSPYRHNDFPFTPLWCYRRGRDGMPYGHIRPIRDPQYAFNKRMAKALFSLSAYRVNATHDAIDPKSGTSWDDVREEAGRPDALLVRKKGSELTVEQDKGIGEEHFKLAQYDAQLVLESSGVSGENLALETNAQSGKAILAKQSEGAAVTTEIFDHYRLGLQLSGEKQLSNVEQFWSEEKIIRITDARGRPTWQKINEFTQLPDGSVRILNDVTATKSDFIIDQQDFHASTRRAGYEALMDAASKIADPTVQLHMIEMAFDMSDLPDKDGAVKRIRSITGYQPEAEALTPEEQEKLKAQQEAQAAAEKEAADLQKKQIQGEIADKMSGAELKAAQAEKARQEAEKIKAEIASLGVGETPEQIAKRDELMQRLQDAEEARAKAEDEAAALKLEARDRANEITEKYGAERYKADRDKEARIHAAEKEAEAKRHAAEQEAGAAKHAADAGHNEDDLADLMQAVEELGAIVKDLASRDDKPVTSEEMATFAERVTKTDKSIQETTKRSQAEQERAKKESEKAKSKEDAERQKADEVRAKEIGETLKAVAAVGEQVRDLVAAFKESAGKKRGGKTITLPGGEKVRVDPDPD